ncbi:hypothetical protein ACFSO7_02775 [Bacillus sp. CGMCC 1.16607]|uniref:hypothetical protein n=1 Tax=Bacillus sp. CGMCC 1.16607 TaxID=3351842 RepID=UPI003638A373
MLFEVDFSIKIDGDFYTVHTELIPALSVSECKIMAENIKQDLRRIHVQEIYIFIGA